MEFIFALVVAALGCVALWVIDAATSAQRNDRELDEITGLE